MAKTSKPKIVGTRGRKRTFLLQLLSVCMDYSKSSSRNSLIVCSLLSALLLFQLFSSEASVALYSTSVLLIGLLCLTSYFLVGVFRLSKSCPIIKTRKPYERRVQGGVLKGTEIVYSSGSSGIEQCANLLGLIKKNFKLAFIFFLGVFVAKIVNMFFVSWTVLLVIFEVIAVLGIVYAMFFVYVSGFFTYAGEALQESLKVGTVNKFDQLMRTSTSLLDAFSVKTKPGELREGRVNLVVILFELAQSRAGADKEGE